MHARAGKRVQIGRQRRHEGLAFAGSHFGDGAFVQHHAADHLHVEVPHLQGSLAGLAHGGEGFRQQLLQRFAFPEPGAQALGSGANLRIGQRLVLRLKPVDGGHGLAHALELARIAAAENFAEHAHVGAGFSRGTGKEADDRQCNRQL